MDFRLSKSSRSRSGAAIAAAVASVGVALPTLIATDGTALSGDLSGDRAVAAERQALASSRAGSVQRASRNARPSADLAAATTAQASPPAPAPVVAVPGPAEAPPAPALRVAAAAAAAPAAAVPAPAEAPPPPAVAVAAPAEAPPAQATTHVVVAGETLAKIARQYGAPYGLAASSGAWRRLYDANPGLAAPERITPGMALRIPAAAEVVAERALPAPAASSPAASAAPAAATAASTPAASAAPAAATASDGVWDRLAACEAGGNWSINTGNGYYGGLQFSLSSWRAVGGAGYPHQTSRETQIEMGERLRARQGWGAWPACSRKLGLR